MAIPAIRRLMHVKAEGDVIVVVNDSVHTQILRSFISPRIRTFERNDGKPFSQLRLWLRLFVTRPSIIVAPMISRKPLNILFFFTLFVRCRFPSTFFSKKFLFFEPSELVLKRYRGHQVNYFVDFIAQEEARLNRSIVSQSEFAPKCNSLTAKSKIKKNQYSVALGISCSILERHKIPSPSFFSELINSIANKFCLKIYIIGSNADLPLIYKFSSGLSKEITLERVIDQPISKVVDIISHCDAGVAGTTGLGHMMAAAGLPLLILSGVTNPYESGPYVDRAAVLAHNYECGPCYQEEFRFGCGVISCMESLNPIVGAKLLHALLTDSDYGKNWFSNGKSIETNSIDKIRKIHLRPMKQWLRN